MPPEHEVTGSNPVGRTKKKGLTRPFYSIDGD